MKFWVSLIGQNWKMPGKGATIGICVTHPPRVWHEEVISGPNGEYLDVVEHVDHTPHRVLQAFLLDGRCRDCCAPDEKKAERAVAREEKVVEKREEKKRARVVDPGQGDAMPLF